ncbi:MAG: DUF438 domain-containing protein [Promethearchaeota archaeon]
MILSKDTGWLTLVDKYPFLWDEIADLGPGVGVLEKLIESGRLSGNLSLLDISGFIDVPFDKFLSKVVSILESNGSLQVEEKEPGLLVVIDKALKEWLALLKALILDLHAGKPVVELKERFKRIIKDITPSELVALEQKLIDDDELTTEQVTKMCDLHVEIFKESLNKQMKPESVPGHPVNTYLKENERASEIIAEIRKDPGNKELIKDLKKIIIHYTRIENQLFPLLEKAGITGPPTVMWTFHDKVRRAFKDLDENSIDDLLSTVEDMIYKENHILFPMALKTLSESDWAKVRMGEEEIGYAWIKPGNEWKPVLPTDIHAKESVDAVPKPGSGSTGASGPGHDGSRVISLNTGNLTVEQLDSILRHLPVEISFVNSDDEVAYYSAHEKRIFPRSPGVIGRKVIHCHPRKSLEKVKSIIDGFRQGKKDRAEFWIQLNGRFLLIRYFAIRNKKGAYLGTLEVTQDITEIKGLTGEKRLLDWN